MARKKFEGEGYSITSASVGLENAFIANKGSVINPRRLGGSTIKVGGLGQMILL